MNKRTLYLTIIFLFTLILIEIILRLLGIASTYSERSHRKFTTYYNFESIDSYHRWTPNKIIEYNQIEFNYSYPANTHGFREKEFPVKKNDSVEIVYVLGDSFVEGDGAPYDSTLTRFLEKLFHKDGFSKVKVFNVGVSGSDPIYQYKFFENELIHTHPEIVIMLTNFSDLYDVQYRGGFERFLQGGGVKFKEAPKGFLLYRYSRIARLIFHALGYREGMLLRKNEEDFAEEINILIDTFVKTDSLVAENKGQFILITHPDPADENPYTYSAGILKYIPQDNENLKTINLTKTLLKKTKDLDYKQYAWPINGHYNSFGYQLMAEAVYEDIKQYYPEIFKSLTKSVE